MALMSTTRGLAFDPALAADMRVRRTRAQAAQANRDLAKRLDEEAKEARQQKRQQIDDCYRERAEARLAERTGGSRKSLPRKRGKR